MKEYKSFALKNKGKLYITGYGLSFSLIAGGILQIIILNDKSFGGFNAWIYILTDLIIRILPSIFSLGVLVFGWIRYN